MARTLDEIDVDITMASALPARSRTEAEYREGVINVLLDERLQATPLPVDPPMPPARVVRTSRPMPRCTCMNGRLVNMVGGCPLHARTTHRPHP
jgi:hypothetical protein